MTKPLKLIRNPAWLCFGWLGIVVGIGAIATPARFATPSLGREVAVDVAREVFVAVNRVELALLVAFLVLVRVTGASRQFLLAAAALALIVISQSAWLIPELSARADIIIAGGTPADSLAHAIYGVLEITKYGVLLASGFASMALLEDSSRRR